MARIDLKAVEDAASRVSNLNISGRDDCSGASEKARLIYCKSHVAIHPTQLKRDNISGLLGLVEVDRDVPRAPDSGTGSPVTRKEMLVVWVPDELLRKLPEEDRRNYQKVEGCPNKSPAVEDSFVFVSLPATRAEKYAFSVPLNNLYSVLVYPPSLSHWYGSVTFNLLGGVSLPTLFFHDDQTPLVSTPRSSDPTPPPWGFPPFLKVLQRHATLLRSRLITPTNNRGGELWLVNPSKSDREVHEAGYEETNNPVRDSNQSSAGQRRAYPPPPTYPNLSTVSHSSPKDSLLVGLSNVTNIARHAAQNVLNHPLAKPVVPHLPPAVRSLVNAPGEWESHRLPVKTGSSRSSDVASEFEAARLYLARWARVVAEEGERSRRKELAAQAGRGGRQGSPEEDLTSLGVFSLVPGTSKRPLSKPTRIPQHPITAVDWNAFVNDGQDELYVRREIFRRGFSDAERDSDARRQGWEVLLGVVPWTVEIGPERKEERQERREKVLQAKNDEYERLLAGWRTKTRNGEAPDEWKEEWHRIDVDCRRTDRNQDMYAVTPEISGNEEKEAGGAGADLWGDHDTEEEGGHAVLNMHIATLRNILMTYHVDAPDLGYVQGMSDLLSPIYYVFGGAEAASFFGLKGVMKMMESNFLRDQSGMRRQLSTLQQLIGLMDPELYAHLESLNLFFCFRWILIAFKREFKFEQVIRLWEVLWTNYYSTNFVLFVALAVLQSHRDVIMRYLTEFDEVLKYANDLTGTIDLDTTLAQAEVLFLSFRDVVQEIDKENADTMPNSTRQRKGLLNSAGGETSSASASAHASTTATGSNTPQARTISPDLRDLLNHWRP